MDHLPQRQHQVTLPMGLYLWDYTYGTVPVGVPGGYRNIYW